MAISVFGKFINMIPSTIYDGADVSMVILVDPPEIPPVFMKNKGVLNTTEKTIKILGDDGVTVVHTFDLAETNLKPIQDQIDALSGRVDGVDGEISAIKVSLLEVEGTANDADALSKENAELLKNALLSDEYGWDVNNLNVYNVSRISRTNNAVNSSGVSIGDADVNLHGDTVGITSGNSGTTYAVFTSGGLNLNDFPLTRMGSGGDTDTNAANIGDVKRIATDGSGLKPTDEEWDMLGYPVINIGTSEAETSASTVGQVNAVKSTADAADTLSKSNKQRLDNLPPAPDLDGYVKNGEDVNFGTAEINIVKVTKGDDKSKFSDILIDGNTNTEMNFVGDTHFYVRDKADNSKGLEAFQIDSSARFVAKQKVKTPIITNLGSGTTNSNSDKAAFIDLSVENEVKLGAKSRVIFNVGGNGIIEAAAAGLKLLSNADANNHNLTNIKHLVGNSAGSMNVANVHIVKRDDSSDTNQSIQFNASDLTAFSDKHEWKTNGNARRLTIENHEANWHDCALTSVNSIWGGSNNNTNGIKFETGTGNVKTHHYAANHIFFNNEGQAQFEILPTGPSAHSKTVRYVGQGSSDTDATNLGHIKELIAASDGGVGFENTITYNQTQSTTFYETTASQKNAWVVATNNDSASSLTFTFDYSRQGQEVVAGVENKTKRTIVVKLKVQQSDSLTVEVPKYSVFSARYVPEIGRYVYNVGSWYPTEQRVVRLEDLNYSTASDPRQVTRNILNAMPNNSICIARHQSGSGNKDTANKNRFISKGDKNLCETEESIAILVKHSTDRATGMSTSQGGDGRAWSRVLDGKRHAWFTNDTANSFSLSSDIDPTQYPEESLFLTGDKGMMKTTVNEEGENVLIEIDGYNVPKNEADIAALEIQTEKNRSVTHYFVNEGGLSYDWPDEERRPLVEVQVLNTMQKINNSSVTVTDNDEHKYSGEYNTVGSLAINTTGNWSNVYVYHNAYKHESESYYVVFNQGNLSWQIIESANPHTSIGEHAAAVTVQLGGQSSLPASFGNYVIDPNFDNIDSLEFFPAEVPTQYDDVNSRVIINFNGAKPSGFVTLK